MKEFEILTLKVAIEGDLNAAHRALILNPIVDSGSHMQDAFEEMVRENIEYMPAFSRVMNK